MVVVAMTRAHCRDAGQREAMVKRGLSALAPGGILWVDAPGQWRSALATALRGRGLAIGSPIVLRARGAARAEFSLTSRALRFALSNGHVSRRWRLVLAVLERVPWGRAMLFRLLPGVGFAAFHAGNQNFRLVGRSTGFRARHGHRGDHQLARRTGAIFDLRPGQGSNIRRQARRSRVPRSDRA